MVRRRLFVGLVATLAATSAFAVVPPDASEALQQKQFQHPDLWYGNVFRPVAELPGDVSRSLGSDLSRLGVDASNAYFDLRTGRWGTLITTRPLIPGSGVGNDLRWSDLGRPEPRDDAERERAAWEAFQGYLAVNASELRIDPSELAEPHVTALGDRVIQIHVGRQLDGIPVRDTFFKAAVNSGNLVLMGMRNWADTNLSTTPRVSAALAEQILGQHLGELSMARLSERPRLEIVPASDQEDEDSLTIGEGVEYRLVWALRPYFADPQQNWEALVDAHDGELLAFTDLTHYASRRVEGGIYPVSNDNVPPDGVEQPDFPMPFANILLDGSPIGFTTTGGNVPPGADTGTISTTLNGQFVRMTDTCGAINESAAAGDLDLLEGPGTDCAVPPGHSAGDTHATRSGFYELNRIKEQGRGYLPTNTWLQGQLTANMNIQQLCNANWSGGQVNFYRSGGGCANTGEIAAIFDHEWGHGMDNNDGLPNISRPGEGIADIYAINRLNTSCVGRNFRPGVNCGGYGDPCTQCTGVRDADWAKRASGIPHTIAWVDANCPAGPNTPCGGATHCEGAIVAETAWDLVHRDLMGFNGSPFNLDLNTALELGTRLAYFGSSTVFNWYQCTTDGTGGCNADSGYLHYIAADDDNGDLTDGTPHMSAIFAAFNRHQMACPTPVVQNAGCAGAPTMAPVNLAATTFDEGMELTWDAVAGATGYQIFRTEGVNGCDFGKALVGETTGTTFSEIGLRNGFEVLYSVLAVGTTDACTSPMSSCLSVFPTAGPSGFIAGTVTDAGTDAPIEGAVVQAVGPVSVSDTTDASGAYQILAPVGTYDVTATADDYDPETETGVIVTEGNTTTVDFELTLTAVPVADISPSSFAFTVAQGGGDSDVLNIGNLGTADLDWSIDTDVPDGLAGGGVRSHDPALDEPFDLGDFALISLANGGEVVSFTVPGGVLTQGDVVGFSFIGSVTGITGNSSWASDMCMRLEAPDGTSYTVGGFTGDGLPGCLDNVWDFDGSGSTNDGTYESGHDDVFDPALGDAGDWTLSFVNDWNSVSAATMEWTDVTVTLHKTAPPVCDDVTAVDWLSVSPDSGTTPPAGTSPVDVMVDSTGVAPGVHEAALCVTTNDPTAPLVPVPVSLTVISGDDPFIDVDPDSLSSTLPEGDTETQELTIANLGGATLDWEVTEVGGFSGRVLAPAGSGSFARKLPSAPSAMAGSGAAAATGDEAMDMASKLGSPLPSLRVINTGRGGIDCDGEPGIIIHDDGTLENGYSGNLAGGVTEVRFVDKFTPSAYPATFSSVCLGFITGSGPTTYDVNIQVYDDDGAGGSPGTLLGSLPASVTVTQISVPIPPGQTAVWNGVDISSLGFEVTEGSVYIGASWAPTGSGLSNVFVAADQSIDRPVGFAGGHWWNNNANVWAPIQAAFPDYRSLMVRAVAGAGGPVDCTLPEWVSVDPTSGSVDPSDSQIVDVTFDSTGLADGDYTANLCLESNDPVNPLVMVPLSLTVGDGGGPIADISPESFDFTVLQGGSDSDTLNMGNIGGGDLTWSLDEAEGLTVRGTDVIADGGFEAGDPNPSWTVGSTNFGTPLCTIAFCGQGGGTGPHGGSWWAWFGGINAVETGFAAQDVTIPATGSAELRFWLEIPVADNPGFLDVSIDGDVVFGVTEADTGDFTTYAEVVVDVSAYADGGTHELRFDSTTQPGAGVTNFFVDDISLTVGEGGGGCDSPTDVPWLSTSPTNGTTPGGGSVPVDVSVDSTGLAAGSYSALLCATTNDPAAELVEVPVSLTVTGGGGPIADINPESFDFTVPEGGGDSDTLNVGNLGGSDLTWTLDEAESPSVGRGGDDWSDDFDSYVAGSQIHGQGGWKGWFNDPAAGALVSDAQSNSSPNSVEIVGASDLVREFDGITDGQWTVTALQFIPNDFNGLTYWIQLNSYDDGGVNMNWSTQVSFTSPANLVLNEGATGGSLPLIKGEWVELRIEIDLDADTQDFFYGGQLLFSGTWSNEVSGGGATTFDTIDLFANSASAVFYDDISLTAAGGGGGACDSPTDVPWLSTSPTNGTTPAGGNVPVTVSVDASGLTAGDYSALLCATTNDPAAELVEVPVSLTVTPDGDVPVIDVDPTSFSFTVPAGGTTADDLAISNIGEGTLIWDIETAEPAGNAISTWRLAQKVGDAPVTASFASGAGGVLPATGNLLTLGDVQMSQTTDTSIAPANSVACPTGPNHLMRRFYFDEHPGIGSPAEISSVEIAIQEGVVNQTLTVNLYTLPSGTAVDTIPVASLTSIGSGSVAISPANDGTIVNVPVSGTVSDTAAFDLVVEATVAGQFFIGATDTGETHPGFILAPACGATTPTRIDSLGPDFADTHIIIVVNAGGGGGPGACDNPTTIPWLSVTPDSGSADAGETDLASVMVDAGAVGEGDYSALLCVNSNDPVTPLVTVPVSLTVVAEAPIADISPGSFAFEVPQNNNASDVLNVGNTGSADLDWSITTDVPEGFGGGVRSHDPALDEPFDLDDFILDSLANGGSPVSFTVPGGVLTQGDVVGFSFIGSVTGISGTSNWASDMCLVIEAPDGTTFAIGGFTGDGLPGCLDNVWDFDGSGSTEDGTYESDHDDVFSEIEDAGDWTLSFVNDWNSTGAGTMSWTEVTVTLHKTAPPICDDVTAVDWLSVFPVAGTTAPGESEAVDVLIDTTGLELGDYEAALCVATNDPAAPVVVVPVALTVTPPTGDEVYTPVALVVDPEIMVSDGNGIFEPNEVIDVAPAWRNDGEVAQSLLGNASNFTGPEGAIYTLGDDDADYGLFGPGETASCLDTGVCYVMGVNDPAIRPATHWEATFDETLSDTDGTTKTWTLHIGESFVDVPVTNLFYPFVETLLHSGITGGCTGSEYCPTASNTRDQMPVFMLKALLGPDYQPPACVEGDEVFDDVSADNLFCPWIEDLFNRGVVNGCGGGNYCPNAPVTRGQMAVFLLRTLEGADYVPPACAGVFVDVPCPSLFGDWIEDLFAREITGGCSSEPLRYCPANPVNRDQMAVFVTRTFGLTLYGP